MNPANTTPTTTSVRAVGPILVFGAKMIRPGTSSRPRPLPPTGIGHIWAYDFVFDACANGQQLKCLTVVDEYTRECVAIDVAGSIRSARVIEVLSRLVSAHGTPKYLRSDNGPEFVSRAVLKWLTETKIDTAHIDPGKPWQNGLNESFNGKFRDECLSMQWFKNRIDAKILIEAFRYPGRRAWAGRMYSGRADRRD